MKINKSSRHAKITGDFGEAVILYWLSKYGFECASVDHTGIDIIARNPHLQEVIGLSIKTRSRAEGTENEYVSIPNDNFEKAEAACRAFGCKPYFAIVVDGGDTLRAFILSMDHLLRLYPKGKSAIGWKMKDRNLKDYESDPEIMSFEFKIKPMRWWMENDNGCQEIT